MNKQYISLSSLSMDLKRASLGFWRGSDEVGRKFLEESIKRRNEVNLDQVPGYLKSILNDLQGSDPERLMMDSILIQNYLIKSTL